MRRGSPSAAQEITGHKHETISEWLCRSGEHAEALTAALVHDLKLEEARSTPSGRLLRTPCGAPDRPGKAQAVGEPAEPGPRRGCVSLARKSRLAIAWQAAASDAQTGTWSIRRRSGGSLPGPGAHRARGTPPPGAHARRGADAGDEAPPALAVVSGRGALFEHNSMRRTRRCVRSRRGCRVAGVTCSAPRDGHRVERRGLVLDRVPQPLRLQPSREPLADKALQVWRLTSFFRW
jgi:hypothetical protein